MAGRNRLTDPSVGYVDNYDRFGSMHPRVAGQMDPMMDTLERSQFRRGARQSNPRDDDAIAEIMEMAAQAGWRPRGSQVTQEDLPSMLEAAAGVATSDGELALIDRAYTTLGLQGPAAEGRRTAAPNMPALPMGGDYVHGGRRPGGMHPAQMDPDPAAINNLMQRR